MTRLWQCSPVAMRMGATSRRMRAWPRMSSGLVGSSIHHGLSGREGAGAFDGFEDAPLLVGVDHELVGPADLFADDVAAAEIVGGVAADFELEVGPAVGEAFAAEAADLFVAEAEPADGGGVGGVAFCFEMAKTVGLWPGWRC